MAVLIDSCYLSICPTCTKEVAAMMGFTPENITKILGGIRRAQTENNRIYNIESGVNCVGCGERFKEGEARVRGSQASNVKSWHMNCYEGQLENKGREEGGQDPQPTQDGGAGA